MNWRILDRNVQARSVSRDNEKELERIETRMVYYNIWILDVHWYAIKWNRFVQMPRTNSRRGI